MSNPAHPSTSRSASILNRPLRSVITLATLRREWSKRNPNITTTLDGDVIESLARQFPRMDLMTYTFNTSLLIPLSTRSRIIVGDEPIRSRRDIRYLSNNHVKLYLCYTRFDDKKPTYGYVGSHNAGGSTLLDLLYEVRVVDLDYLFEFFNVCWNLAVPHPLSLGSSTERTDAPNASLRKQPQTLVTQKHKKHAS